MTQEEITSIERQIANIKKNLLDIDETISEYPEKEKIPLHLKRNKQEHEQELQKLHERLITIAPTSVALPKHLYVLPDYLNRSAQESALSAAINNLAQMKNQPILCIFHGDEHQCHSPFSERLIKSYIPELLDIQDSEKTSIKCYYPSFPINFKDRDKFNYMLQQSLAKNINEVSRNVSAKIINDCLAKYPGPVILYIHLLADDLPKSSLKFTLDSFIDFWDKWPPLAEKQQLIVFLSIKYFQKKKRLINFSFDKNDISMIIEKHLPTQLSSCKRLIGIVLPKLEGITRHEVEEWAHVQCRNHFLEQVDFNQYIESKIREIFEQYKSNDSPKKIPMEYLAFKLRSILGEYIRRSKST
ncbi:MAG: hypothetical protein RM022_031280 [Nostoc sp. EfeVER01]|uniref:hypothetical protein n=1 Tax=unclassified Nostoc TaxID=2593658 RepID=UPI002AD30822|nr:MULTISPECIES: hypothetical protein [unclassified Nostoc]MDZ7945697.1 hypothetical protein [Nostoc sp. EfeVER01]MDZ7995937.1 hypothetical protein [Nostoc sp. EspVER01]